MSHEGVHEGVQQGVQQHVPRRCSRTACRGPAVATLTYVYADQTAVLGPLATYAEPHTYDLCAVHADRLSAPRGWDTVRLVDVGEDGGRSGSGPRRAAGSGEVIPEDLSDDRSDSFADDLAAVVDAVRESAPLRREPPRRRASSTPAAQERGRSSGAAPSGTVETARRGHLRILRDS